MNLGKESETIEFKKSTSELRVAMDDICSILNKHGMGVLYFGVKPDGDACGQEIGVNTLDDIATYIKTAIKPMIYPTISEEKKGDVSIIKVEFKGSERPYSSYNRYFKRVHDRAEDMTPDELKHMMLNTDYSSIWENNLTAFGIEDIDRKALRNFYEKAVDCGRLEPLGKFDEKELLEMLGLMIDNKLTNAGFFLFSNKEPTVLKMAVYATDERIKFLDIVRFRNNIYNLIDTATLYIAEHMNWRVEFSDTDTSRIEIPEVPMEAIREIVVNSFAHANYRGETEHEISITPTVIDIYNPGEFPLNYKPEDFAENRIQSMPRNKKILDVLFRSKNVEIQGSGIRKVLKLCAIYNIKYSYYNNEYGFRFSFSRNNLTLSSVGNIKKDKSPKPSLLGDIDDKVLKLIDKNSSININSIALKIGRTERTIQRSIAKLKNLGLLIRNGNNRIGYWKITK